MVFDIGLTGESADGTLSFHQPVTPPLPIRPFTLRVPSALQVSSGEAAHLSCELCIFVVYYVQYYYYYYFFLPLYTY
jgi:hypothetical protein